MFPADYDFWTAGTYENFSLGQVEHRLLHPNAVPHLAFIAFWLVWYLLTRILEFDLLLEYILKCFEKPETTFAEATEEIEAAIQHEHEEEERRKTLGIDTPAALPAKSLDKSGDHGIEMQAVSLDAPDDTDDGKKAEENSGGGGGAPGTTNDDRDESNPRKSTSNLFRRKEQQDQKMNKLTQRVESNPLVDVNGGSPSTSEDDSHPGAVFEPPGGEAEGNNKRASLSRQSSLLGNKGMGSKKTSVRTIVGSEPSKELVNTGKELHYVKFDSSTQESLDMDEMLKFEKEMRHGSFVEGEEDNDDYDPKSKKKKKKKKKGARGSIFGGSKKKKNKDEENEEEAHAVTRLRSATQVSMEDMTEEELHVLHDFRIKWLERTQYVQTHRGHRHIEGNPDFVWAIPTEELTKHLFLKVLSKKVLENYETELHLRQKFPDFHEKINRHIRGVPSYDFFANEDYIEAFAMETKSIKNYFRGKMQVSGEDFALAHAGVWNWIKKHFLGIAREELDVVFPEIRDELSVDAERHTTAIGFDPTKVAGPRFILNIRVPPPPPNLISNEKKKNPHIVTNLEDKNYDEWEENWQYLRISVKDVFSYRIRLPKGLQAKKIPEIQVEIPCVEQTLSTHKTILIGGVRVATGGAAAELSQQAAINITNGVDAGTVGEALRGHAQGPGKHELIETTLLNIKSASDAEQVDRDRKHKKDLESANEHTAASKIQAAWKGKQVRSAAKQMKRWEMKYLIALEGGYATTLAIVLVVADLTLSIGYSQDYPAFIVPFGFFVSAFFLLELSLRFYCYSTLNKSDGCDFSDCNFFTQDYTRLVDLVTVILDVISVIVLILANNGPAASYLRTGKGARAVRAFKLIRFVRAVRVSKLARIVERDILYQLTGLEPMSSQRFHINAPKEIEKGNRLDIMIPHLGKVNVQFPLYAREDQPIQFHLPIICKHHLGELAPNCLLARPHSIDDAVTNSDYSDKMQQYGWLQMWSTLDDDGLGVPPIKKHKLKSMMKKGKSEEECKHEIQIEEYKDFYDDYKKHRVWYQMMAFAPKPVVKKWTDIELFSHEVAEFHDDIVMTLPPGELKGERIECKIDTKKGILHHQKHCIHVPGVGDVNTIILATNEVTVPGLFNHPLRALGVLPWDARPVEARQLIPDVIAEVTFDFPAITLPRATEIISMRMNKRAGGDLMGGGADATAVSLGSDKNAVSHGKYLERETFTRSFQVMPNEIVLAMKIAQKKAKKEARRAERKKRRENRKGWFRKNKLIDKLDEALEEIEEDIEEAIEGAEESVAEHANSIRALSRNDSDDDDDKDEKGLLGGAPTTEIDDKAADDGAASGSDDMEASKSSEPSRNKKKPEPKKKPPSTQSSSTDDTPPAPPPAGQPLHHDASITDHFAEGLTEHANEQHALMNDKAQKAVEAGERTRAQTLIEAQQEAQSNMEGVDLESLREEAMDVQKILLPRIGRFDVAWPPNAVEPFNVSFPAIKPVKHLREEVQTLIEIPSDNNTSISPMARRYQFGWVLVELLEPSPSGKKVYLRLPAYVSHRQRALGTLDPDDFASPYSNRLHRENEDHHHDNDNDSDESLSKKNDLAEEKIKQLEAEIARLQAAMNSNAATATPNEDN
jgi:hypothetical protein